MKNKYGQSPWKGIKVGKKFKKQLVKQIKAALQ